MRLRLGSAARLCGRACIRFQVHSFYVEAVRKTALMPPPAPRDQTAQAHLLDVGCDSRLMVTSEQVVGRPCGKG